VLPKVSSREHEILRNIVTVTKGKKKKTDFLDEEESENN
jgi:hypothetical protein